MNKPFQAIYEGGVLKPLAPLSLSEHELVSVVVEQPNGAAPDDDAPDQDDWRDRDALAVAEREGEGAISPDELREQLKLLAGSISDVVISERGDY